MLTARPSVIDARKLLLMARCAIRRAASPKTVHHPPTLSLPS